MRCLDLIWNEQIYGFALGRQFSPELSQDLGFVVPIRQVERAGLLVPQATGRQNLEPMLETPHGHLP